MSLEISSSDLQALIDELNLFGSQKIDTLISALQEIEEDEDEDEIEDEG